MQVNDPFEKQQQHTRARLVCQATRETCDRLQSPHPGALVSWSGPRRDPTRGILYTPAAGVQGRLLLGKCRAWGRGSRVARRRAHPLRSPTRSRRTRMGAARPTPTGSRGRGPGAWGTLPPSAAAAPPGRHPAPLRGPSAYGDRPGPHLVPRPHLVEAVLAVGFRLHLHLHQHRVRPRHIAQHGWGRRCLHSRLLFGVHGDAALPPIRPSPGLGEGGPERLSPCRPLSCALRPPRPPTTRLPAGRLTLPVSTAAPHSSSPTACAATGTPLI